MSRISAKQRYEAFSEWLIWFNKETGRTKKVTKTEQKTNTTDKSFKVDVKGFRKRK
jgi:hypothetical protein